MKAGQEAPLLKVRNLDFSFLPGQRVLEGLSFDLYPGEILGLAGENGAGKTTLARILAGQLTGYRGTLDTGPAFIRITLVPQHPEFARDFTLGENLILGREGVPLFHLLDPSEIQTRLDEVSGLLGFSLDCRQRAGDLTSTGIQKAAIAGALLESPRILLLDEPTSSLPPSEAQSLLDAISVLARERNLGVIFISHRLEEMMSVCSSIIILEDGRIKSTVEKKDFSLEGLATLMVGAPSVRKESRKPESFQTRPLLEVRNLKSSGRRRGSIEDLCFELMPGEILGMAGLREEGLEALEDCLSGILPWTSGEVTLNGQKLSPGHPGRFRKAGLGYVPADRMTRGAIPEASILENLIPHQAEALSPGGILQKQRTLPFFRKLQEMMDFQGHPDQPLGELSGGNIQRLILSRELEVQPDVLLLSEPSWGLDLASRRLLHDLLRDLRAQGRGILLLSSDLGELLDLSDRLGVIYRGRLTALKPAQNWAAGELDRGLLGES